MIPSHAEVIATHLARALGPCTASESVAVAMKVGIRNEAAVRRALATAGEIGSAVAISHAATVTTPGRRRVNARVFESEKATKARPVVHWRKSGNGPPLLLLNGWTASGLAWPSQWLSRLEESYDVIRIDNRGTGWSRSAPWPFTIEDLADDARDVLDDSAIGPAAVLGISMGGMIAQELAIRHSDIVEKLVLVATRPPTPAHTPMSSDALRLTWGRPPRGHSLREYFVTTWAQTAGDGFAAAHPQVLEELGDQIMPANHTARRPCQPGEGDHVLAWAAAAAPHQRTDDDHPRRPGSFDHRGQRPTTRRTDPDRQICRTQRRGPPRCA